MFNSLEYDYYLYLRDKMEEFVRHYVWKELYGGKKSITVEIDGNCNDEEFDCSVYKKGKLFEKVTVDINQMFIYMIGKKND